MGWLHGAARGDKGGGRGRVQGLPLYHCRTAEHSAVERAVRLPIDCCWVTDGGLTPHSVLDNRVSCTAQAHSAAGWQPEACKCAPRAVTGAACLGLCVFVCLSHLHVQLPHG